MAVSTHPRTLFPLLLIDLIAVGVVWLAMYVSRTYGVPLYVIEPMRWIVFISLLIVHQPPVKWLNALLLAVVLPISSYFLSGHPILVKNLLIAAELSLNVVLLQVFLHKRWQPFWAVIAAILISKAVYYLLKYIVVTHDLLALNIISTELWIQGIVSVAIAALFAKCYHRNKMHITTRQ